MMDLTAVELKIQQALLFLMKLGLLCSVSLQHNTNITNVTMMLFYIGTDNVVSTSILLDNPNADGTCHNLDANLVEVHIINSCMESICIRLCNISA